MEKGYHQNKMDESYRQEPSQESIAEARRIFADPSTKWISLEEALREIENS